MTTTHDRPPHQWVANKIGLSVSGVSLLRSGARGPSWKTMEIIEQCFDWPVCDQVSARHNYAEEFNSILQSQYQEQEGSTE